MIFKFQINVRLGPDMNTATSTEVVVDTDEEAQAEGKRFMELHAAFMEGVNDYTPKEDD